MTYEEIIGAADAIRGAVKLPRKRERVIENPNHHIWDNRGTWWCNFTVIHHNNTSERVRVSLKTDNVEEAKLRRDQLLAALS